MKQKILIWDNDGTIMGAKDSNDTSHSSKIILPNIEETMLQADLNFIISGCKTPESELQDFDPENVIKRFKDLMTKLPIQVAAFSPAIGGVECYVVLKKDDGEFEIKKAHEEPRYKNFIGKFKKPDIGMFIVLSDIAKEEFGQIIDEDSACIIGDTWHDEAVAKSFGIPFVDATEIHQKKLQLD